MLPGQDAETNELMTKTQVLSEQLRSDAKHSQKRFRRPAVENLERRLLLTRVSDDLVALYTFDEGSGNTVSDVSGNGSPLDLVIADTANVTWGTDSLTIDAPTLISSQVAATKIYNEITLSEEITVEAWVTPENNSQTGPARIVTMSSDSSNRNFTLSARGIRYDSRFRTTTTGLNGNSPPVRSPNNSVSVALTHVVYTQTQAGTGSVYLDGVLRASGTIGGNLSNWDPGYEFGLVNEFDLRRPWLGTLDLVAVYSQALSPADIALNFAAGPDPVLTLPTADIVDVSPDPRGSAVGATVVDFSVPVTGVSIDDFTLTRDGSNVDLSALAVTGISPQQFELDLTSVTQAPGAYELTLEAAGSGIQDVSGNALTGDATDSFVIGTVPVAAITEILPDPALLNAGNVSVSFTENVSGVDITDFSLLRDGNPVGLAGVSVIEATPTQYSLDLSAVTAVSGNYTLTLDASGSGIQSAVGVPLSADASEVFSIVTAPIALNDSFATGVDQSVITASANGVLNNDSDPNASTLFVDPVPVVDVSNGSLTLSADGAFQYDPNTGFIGTDSFTYRVTNGFGLTDTADVTIQVADPSTGPKLRTGIATINSSGWTTITVDATYNTPVVVATVVHDSSVPPPIVTRVVNATSGNSFDLKLDRADGQTGNVSADVHYLVVEAGTYSVAEHGIEMEAFITTSTRTDRTGSWVASNVTGSVVNSYATPIVLGQVMTYNDPDWSAFWTRGGSRFQPPVAGNIRVGKHVGTDPDSTRADEDLGVVIFEAGAGSVDGFDYVAALGSDIIVGVDDGANSYPLPLAGANTVVATQAAMDGSDGGWAVLNGDSPLASSAISLVIDEETISDAERSHATEQVAWIAFAGGDSVPPTASISTIAPSLRNLPVSNVDLTFSEPVIGFDTADLLLTRDGSTVDISGLPVTGSGAQYTVDLSTVTGVDGSYVLTLSAGGIQDLAGNTLANSTTQLFTVETVAPSLDIVDVSPDPRASTVGIVIVSFDEPVLGVDVNDFEMTRDGLQVNLSGVPFSSVTPQQYSIDLSTVASGDGDYLLTFVSTGSGVTDLAGNPLAIDAVDSFTVDGTAPTVDIVDVVPDPRATVVGTVSIVFSEDVTGVDPSDFELTRDAAIVDLSSVPLVSVSPQEYSLDLTSVTAADGTYELTLDASATNIQDAAGNVLAASSVDTFVVDTTAPVADIVDVAPDPRTSAVGIVTVNFDEGVSGVELSDFELTRNGNPVDVSSIPFVAVTSQQYTLDLSSVTIAGGQYLLTLNAATSGVTDTSGNPLDTDAADGFVVDVTAPTADIVDVVPDPRTTPVDIVTVFFDEDVTGVDELLSKGVFWNFRRLLPA